MVNVTLQGCHIYLVGQHQHWPMQNVPDWIKNSSGTAASRLDSEVTHVLISENLWRKQTRQVQEVLEHKSKGHNVHVLSYEWLNDCLSKKRRASEVKYALDKPTAETREMKSGKDREPRSHAGMVEKLFTASTDGFVDAREQRRIEKEEQAMEQARKDAEAARQQDIEKKRKDAMSNEEIAAIFRRGAQRARNELLSDNFHIYLDATGFYWDIVLTKVQSEENRNGSCTLTVYESNVFPHTYAMCCQMTSAGKEKTSSIIAALGSTQETALRAFKKVFKEKTELEWNDRLTTKVARTANGQGRQQNFTGTLYRYSPDQSYEGQNSTSNKRRKITNEEAIGNPFNFGWEGNHTDSGDQARVNGRTPEDQANGLDKGDTAGPNGSGVVIADSNQDGGA